MSAPDDPLTTTSILHEVPAPTHRNDTLQAHF